MHAPWHGPASAAALPQWTARVITGQVNHSARQEPAHNLNSADPSNGADHSGAFESSTLAAASVDAESSRRVAEALTHFELSLDWLERAQAEDGSWRGDYGGPLFLLPLFVGAARVVGYALDATTQREMARYLLAQQNEDGGFGLHVEGHSHMFTSVLAYVALRQLGERADTPALARALAWVHDHGGPECAAPWGKFALAWMGLYAYEGLDPILPELWLLPEASPIHPSRLWCHCRMVYLPMAYLYGRRAQAPCDALTLALRTELYRGHYDRTDWKRARTTISETDVYRPLSPLMRQANRAMTLAERALPKGLRARALDYVRAQIRAEDENTSYICLGPINKLYDMLVCFFDDPNGAPLARHKERLEDYLWRGKDGVKMQGYNSSQLWDTAFAAQAILTHPQGAARSALIDGAARFIEANQVINDTPNRARTFRHASKGGWPFSTRAHGWPISDCTAEGLKAALKLGDATAVARIDESRLEDAAKLLLTWQNDDGGFPTYELKRGSDMLEWLNPSLVFDRIMVDYSYVECTSACIQALVHYRAARPERFPTGGAEALRKAEAFLRAQQRTDGSFEGSWGVCFSYGTWFAVAGLRALGAPASDPALQAARRFLLSHQRADGAWGETAESCRARHWVEAETGQVVTTAWALLALMEAGEAPRSAIDRGLTFLCSRQQVDGSYPNERIAGVFNRTCAIHYDNYLKIFPTWVFGRYASLYGTHKPGQRSAPAAMSSAP